MRTFYVIFAAVLGIGASVLATVATASEGWGG